jgi:FkbM family methyltransferase
MPIAFPASIQVVRDEIIARLGASFRHYTSDLDLLLHLRWLGFEPSTIYDIGASNTIWSVVAHAVFPEARLELFEPLAEISDAYLHQKRTHQAVREFLEAAEFQMHPIALGNENAECIFNHFAGDSGSTSLDMGHVSPSAKQIKVPMRRLDDHVSSQKLVLPDLIKMDTQGAEQQIMEGGPVSFAHASVVFVECWLTKGYGQKTPLMTSLANMLSELDFNLFGLGDEFRSPEGIPQTRDAVFVKSGLPLAA